MWNVGVESRMLSPAHRVLAMVAVCLEACWGLNSIRSYLEAQDLGLDQRKRLAVDLDEAGARL